MVLAWRLLLGCVGLFCDVFHRGEVRAAASGVPDSGEGDGYVDQKVEILKLARGRAMVV
jgi:hypothetical protein